MLLSYNRFLNAAIFGSIAFLIMYSITLFSGYIALRVDCKKSPKFTEVMSCTGTEHGAFNIWKHSYTVTGKISQAVIKKGKGEKDYIEYSVNLTVNKKNSPITIPQMVL